MADSELDDREADLSKKDRLINAWLAAGPDAMAKNVAEVTDSSVAYASRIESQMEDGDIGEDDVGAVRDEALVDEYATRLERLAQRDGDATAGTEGGGQSSGNSDRRRPSTREAQQHHQQRQQEAAQRRETAQQPPQQGPLGQPQQQPPQQQPPQQQPPQQLPQRSGEGFPDDAAGSVPVERLRELDRVLCAFEEEAQFEVQHLSRSQAAEAVGKLFVAGKARSLLRDAVEDGRDERTQ
ncbi:hypothetical protein [Halomicrobium salinisoli]|uniref:hypothetical protein n=1 Tax=Halomicrobium salinisoli TaxID=2878391 RepID=UPI001CF0B960|nr:hypothetical protein [Halomicrobium salinisoli]